MRKRSVDLFSYVPPFLNEYQEFNAILSAETSEFQELSDQAISLPDETLITSANEKGLTKFEEILNLTPNTDDSVEERRRRVLAYEDSAQPYTINYLKNRIQILQGNDDVSVYLDENDPFLLHVVTGYLDERYLEDVREMVKEMLPANMTSDVHSRMEEQTDIYGVEIDFNASFYHRIKRLCAAAELEGGSDFDNISPWGGRYRCLVARDGTELCAYGDSAYRETGYPAQNVTKNGKTYYTTTPVNVMVKQPKFYYYVSPLRTKKTEDGVGCHTDKIRYYISPVEKEGFKLHPLFIDGDEEKDCVYLSAFECAWYDVSQVNFRKNNSQTWNFNEDWLASIADALPTTDTSLNDSVRLDRANLRKLANNVGTGWHLAFTESYSASAMLFLIEYASFDSGYKIDKGNYISETLYKTGTTGTLGNASGYVANSNNVRMTSYRGEENLWSNAFSIIDGMNITYDSNNQKHYLYVCNDRNFADEKTTDNYHKVNISLIEGRTSWAKSLSYSKEYDWMFIPYLIGSKSEGDATALHISFPSSNRTGVVLQGFGCGIRTSSAGPALADIELAPAFQYGDDVGGRSVYIPKSA